MFFREPSSFSRSSRVEVFFFLSVLFHLLIFFLLSRSVPSFQPKPQPTHKDRPVTRILLQNPNSKESAQEPKDARYLAETAHKAQKETRREGGLSLPSMPRRQAHKRSKKPAPKKETSAPRHQVPNPNSELLASIPKLPSPEKSAQERGRPSSLFPSIQELARADKKPAVNLDEAIEKGELINLNTKEFKYVSYFLSIKRAVEGCMSYPEDMALQGISGGGLVAFTVEKEGVVSEVRIVRSSGYTSFDHEIVRAIRMASPLNPIPARLGKDRLFLVWPFEFVLYRFFS